MNELAPTQALSDSGGQASDVAWDLAVSMMDGSRVEILEGEAADGLIQLTLPSPADDASVLAAADENGGIVNFIVSLLSYDAPGEPTYASFLFYANFGDSDWKAAPSEVGAVTMRPLVPCPDVDIHWSMGTCWTPPPISTVVCDEYDHTQVSTDLVAKAQLHASYGMTVEWGMGGTTHTRVMTSYYQGIQAGGTWERNGWKAVNTKFTGYDGVAVQGSAGAVYLTESAAIGGYYRHYLRQKQTHRDNWFWDDGACIYESWTDVGDYRNTGPYNIEVMEVEPPNPERNEASQLIRHDDWYKTLNQGGLLERVTGTGEEIASGTCWGTAVNDPWTSNIGTKEGICEETSAGFTDNVKLKISVGLDCDQWFIYNDLDWDGGGSDWDGTVEGWDFYYVDAGDAGNGTYVDPITGNQYPAGCGPLG